MGFEPTRPLGAAEFKSATTTNSVTRAVVVFSHRVGPGANESGVGASEARSIVDS